MITSPTIAAIASALADAQVEIQNPVKDRTAKVKSDKGNYEYNYADLSSVLDAVRPVLARNGIALLQSPEVTPTKVNEAGEASAQLVMTTRLLHKSGEWIENQLVLEIDPLGKIQSLGSAITYLRRYALQSIVGVVAEEDDDGNAAQGTQAQNQRREPQPVRQPVEAQTISSAMPPGAPVPPAINPLKAESDELCIQLARVSSEAFAKDVWASATDATKRRDLLKQAVDHCREIMTAIGDDRGHEVIIDIVRSKHPAGARLARLTAASLGEIPAKAGA